MRRLSHITIRGFKSIRAETLELDELNVFIGGNGAGKSNLIEVFRFLHEVVQQRLERYVLTRGGADHILHFGRKTTPQMELVLEFVEKGTVWVYQLKIDSTNESGLVIAWEYVEATQKDAEVRYTLPVGYVTGDDGSIDGPGSNRMGHYAWESRLLDDDREVADQLVQALIGCRVYHFHDTSDTAAMKGICDLHDNRLLRPQGENLAAMLYYMQKKAPDHFAFIEDTVAQIAPFFGGFRLQPLRLDETKIRLEWHEKGHDGTFHATSFSDGTLRFICLATLLLQPDLPGLILLDEPELGLHPAAITLLADLLISASQRTQIVVATQSVTLINQLEPGQVWTVDRENDQSTFRKLQREELSEWLGEYALGELWEKNLIRARP